MIVKYIKTMINRLESFLEYQNIWYLFHDSLLELYYTVKGKTFPCPLWIKSDVEY